jgi:hypothetical protein
MRKVLYFSGETELANVGNYLVAEIEASARREWPVRLDLNGPRQLAGRPKAGFGLLPVTREIKLKNVKDRHACDWRCMGAFPKGECACECMGRNHGKTYKCD